MCLSVAPSLTVFGVASGVGKQVAPVPKYVTVLNLHHYYLIPLV